jgi:hypothetical protein
MTSALVGIIIIVSAYGIIWLVGNAIGLPILSVGDLIRQLYGDGATVEAPTRVPNRFPTPDRVPIPSF